MSMTFANFVAEQASGTSPQPISVFGSLELAARELHQLSPQSVAGSNVPRHIHKSDQGKGI